MTAWAKLVGDITYLRTGEGWLYLATVIDLYSRQIVGWSMGENMQTQLVIDAMKLAASRGFIQPGSVFHSDRGTQYTSDAFQGVVHRARGAARFQRVGLL